MNITTYSDTIQWMFARLPMYQLYGASELNYKLDKIQSFSTILKTPHLNFPSIHIGGTNGKGSSSHMLASILQTSGYKVGLYTSPHLVDFRERIKVNGCCISEMEVINFIQKYHEYINAHQLSFFECTVGMAFDYFSQTQVDIAVVEVGLGGRLDSTNIITPKVSLITNVSMDHMSILGNNLHDIAFEKSGIIKHEVPIVLSEYQEEVFNIFSSEARQKNAPLIVADSSSYNYPCDLKGDYQSKNIQGVLELLNQLREMTISKTDIRRGLLNVASNTGIRGRWQQVNDSPKVILDVAHNIGGFKEILKQIKTENATHNHFILGFVSDKDVDALLGLLPKDSTCYYCEPDVPRALPLSHLLAKSKKHHLIGCAYNSISQAYDSAMDKASNSDFIYIGGSTFMVADYFKFIETHIE